MLVNLSKSAMKWFGLEIGLSIETIDKSVFDDRLEYDSIIV